MSRSSAGGGHPAAPACAPARRRPGGGLAPAALRNIAVAHQWSLVSSHGGLNFYIGNREAATGFYPPVPGISPTIGGQEKDARAVAARALGHPVNDAEASEYFFALSRAWMIEHPAHAGWLLARKALLHVQRVARAAAALLPFYAREASSGLRFLAVGPWLLIPLGLAGLTVALQRRRTGHLVWLSVRPGLRRRGCRFLRRGALSPAAARAALCVCGSRRRPDNRTVHDASLAAGRNADRNRGGRRHCRQLADRGGRGAVARRVADGAAVRAARQL